MAEHRIGKTYVEVDMDYTPYSRASKRLYKDATQVSTNIEKNFKNLGIRSAKEFDLMRAKITNSYNMIAKSGKASTEDRIRAEKAMVQKLKRINDQQYGHTTSMLDKLKKNWQAYSVGAIAALYAINRFVQKTLEEFKKYEIALIDMAKVTDQAFEVIDASVKKLDSSLGDSTALMKGYYQVISAGVTDPKAAMDLLTTAAKVSKAAHLGQSEVIKALTKVMKGFEGEIRSTEEAADLLFTTERWGQTTVAELVPVIGDIAKASKVAGISHTEMAAAMALITQTAGGTSEAATQYRSIIMGLLRPNEKLTELVSQYGFETGIAMVKTLGFSDTLKLIKSGAADANIQIGKLFRSSEGMLGLASLSANDFEEYNELIKRMGEGAGSSAEAFDRFLESAQAVDEELETNFKKLLIEIGEYIEPFAKKIKEELSGAFDILAESIRRTNQKAEFWEDWVAENITHTGQWIEIITESGEKLLILKDNVEAYYASLKKGSVVTKETGGSFEEIQKKIAIANEKFEKWWKQFSKAKSAMNRVTLAAMPKYEQALESVRREYEKLNKIIEENAEKAGYSIEKIAKLHKDLSERMMDDVGKFAESFAKDIRGTVKETKKATDDIKDLLSDIKGLDFKGQSFGNELADGINNAMISMQSLNDLFIKHAKIQEGINKLIAEGREEEAKKAQAALNAKGDDYFQAQISGYRQLFGTVSQLFKENSKEREIMHKAEMAFAALEIAMTAQKAIMSAVAGIAGQATGDPYTAFARIAAMIALMGSVLAMAGIAFGGGGGSSGGHSGIATPTTGTVLGDPTKSSKSLQHSLDLMEEYHAEDYAELVGIHNEMKDLNKNITGLVSNIVRGFGSFEGGRFEFDEKGPLGKISDKYMEWADKIENYYDEALGNFSFLADKITIRVTEFINDILFGLGNKLFGGDVKIRVTGAGIALGGATVGETIAGETPSVSAYYDIYKKTSGGLFSSTKRDRWTEFEAVDADVERLFNKIYENISNMLVYLAEGFNYTAEDMAAVFAYEFEAMKIDLKGLTGAEITEKINEWISTLGDTAVEALFSEVVGKYQEIDEGMLETAMRLIAQKEILLSVMEMTNQAFDDTSASAIDFSQALIAVASDFESLIEAISNYYDKFFTDAEKQRDLFAGLTVTFDDLSLALPLTRDGFRDLVESLDLTTDAGKHAYVALMTNADAMDAFYSYFEDLEDEFKSISDAAITQNMDQYAAKLYEINQKYKTYADDLATIGMLYDEQGNLTDIATKALIAYNLEIQRLANVILKTIADTQRQLALMGMESGQASLLGIASRYGIAPSTLHAQGQDFLSWYAQADPQEIAIALAAWGVSIDQFNQDMITLGNYYLNQSESHHHEAQATRNELINSLDNAIGGIESMLADLSPTGKYAPVQSAAAFQIQYEKLIEQIRTSDDPGKYVSQLQSFLPDYLSFAEAYGGDYKDLVASVQADLTGLNIELKTERDYLQEIAESTGSTATNTADTAALLNLGIPISFNTVGLDASAVAFLQGLQEIVGLVGWNSQFTIDFVSNYTGFTTMPFDDFVNVLIQVAEKVPGGWYAPITMDMIMSFENWDDASLEEKVASWGAILGVYGWHSPVVFEFMVDMVDTGTVTWDQWLAILPDETIEKELIMYLNNQTGMSAADLSNIFGADTVASMHIGADLIWPAGGYLDVVVGNAVTLAKFGNMNADTWTNNLYIGIIEMWKELVRIRQNTAALNTGLNLPSYALGGLTSGRSFAGETGPEWVVPTYEPQRSSFLRDVGADPEEIGKAVAKHLMPMSQITSNEGQEIHVHIEIDGQEIRNPVIIGLQGRDTGLIEATRRATR